jgi:type IV pilus assembly protein PilE
MAGVTLIELMVVMVIIAILTAIAIPSYRSHVIKTNRRAAESCLSEYAQFMERYYTTNLRYDGAAPAPGCQLDANLHDRYTFLPSNLAQSTYTVTATPIGAQLSDTSCGALSIKQDGTRLPTTAGCW